METMTVDWDALRETFLLDDPIILPCGATMTPPLNGTYSVARWLTPEGHLIVERIGSPKCWLYLQPDTSLAHAVAEATRLGVVVLEVWQAVPLPDTPPAEFGS